MKVLKEKQVKRRRRQNRIRAKFLKGVIRLRLCVSKSNKHIYAQFIDDAAGQTLVAVNDKNINIDNQKSKNPCLPAGRKNQKSKIQVKNEKLKEKNEIASKKIAVAYEVGRLIAQKALEKGIKKAVFDRRGCQYHGIIKAVAEGAREEGLQF